jgi:mono/diheme cytochrome c family protein
VTAQSKEGEKCFQMLNCTACHSIHNAGGRLGPMLDGVGAHRNEDYLLAHLINTEEAKQAFAKITGSDFEYLHHPRISEKSAKSIVDFLLTIPEPIGGFILLPHTTRLPSEKPINNPNFKPSPVSTASKQGKELYDTLGCVACHSINSLGGWLGPALDGVGGRYSADYILNHITSPSIQAGEQQEFYSKPQQMPAFKLSREDLQKITDYLNTLPNHD